MKTNFYLIVNQRGSVRVANKQKPALRADEICIASGLAIPDSLFVKPQLSASIIVEDKDAKPFQITADTANNIKDAIEVAAGVRVELTFNPINI